MRKHQVRKDSWTKISLRDSPTHPPEFQRTQYMQENGMAFEQVDVLRSDKA